MAAPTQRGAAASGRVPPVGELPGEIPEEVSEEVPGEGLGFWDTLTSSRTSNLYSRLIYKWMLLLTWPLLVSDKNHKGYYRQA